MTPHAPTNTAYPFAGQVYLAVSPSLNQRGLVKFGRTRRTAEQRAKEHPGVLSTEKSEVVFVLDTLDCVQAEAQVKKMMAARQRLPFGRKELSDCTVSEAQALVQAAVARAAVAPARVAAAKPAADQGRLVSCHPVAARLLEMPWHLGQRVQPLGAWMVQSLSQPALARKLSARGLTCTNPSREFPEFSVEGQVLASAWCWLSSQAMNPKELQDPVARVFQWLKPPS